MAELNNSGTGQWSEVDASNVSASPNGWPSGTLPSQVEPIGRSTMGAIKRFWDRINATVTSGGSSNTYTYTPANTSFPTAYVTGETYSFKANFANTGAATLNINSLGAKNLFKPGASGPVALAGGEIQSGQIVMAMYDGTQFQITSQVYGGGGSSLLVANNLSDLGSPSTARNNLGLGTASLQATGVFLQTANNFSDVANAATARSNLMAAQSGANTDITSLSSPALGSPTMTTQSQGTNTNQGATCAFVLANAGGSPSALGIGAQVLAKQASGSTVNAGGTTAGANLTIVTISGSAPLSTGDTASGTWRAMQTVTSGTGQCGLWLRTA